MRTHYMTRENFKRHRFSVLCGARMGGNSAGMVATVVRESVDCHRCETILIQSLKRLPLDAATEELL